MEGDDRLSTSCDEGSLDRNGGIDSGREGTAVDLGTRPGPQRSRGGLILGFRRGV